MIGKEGGNFLNTTLMACLLTLYRLRLIVSLPTHQLLGYHHTHQPNRSQPYHSLDDVPNLFSQKSHPRGLYYDVRTPIATKPDHTKRGPYHVSLTTKTGTFAGRSYNRDISISITMVILPSPSQQDKWIVLALMCHHLKSARRIRPRKASCNS